MHRWVRTQFKKPEYYKSVLVKYTDIFGKTMPALAWRASDGDHDIWTITGTDAIITKVLCWKYYEEYSQVEEIELLEAYSKFLEESGYIDSDWWQEQPTAIDEFLKERG